MGLTIGGIGALASGGSALYSLFGGGSNTPTAPTVFQPQNLSGADANAYSGIGNLGQYNNYGAVQPQANATFNSLYNNPYASTYQAGSNAIAPTAWGVGGQQVGAGSDLINSGQSMLPYAQSILNTGFDPQSALYARTLQQTTDQTRAAQAARGIQTSPYGAGVENTALSNFNIDWQNQQLNRQNTAAQGAGYLTNSAGNAINLGQNVGTQGINTLNAAAALPYSTANTIGNNQFGAINSFGGTGQQATTIPQQQISDYLQYLGLGNSAASTANSVYGNQNTAQQNQFNQQQILGSNLGKSISGIGTAYGNGGFNWMGGGAAPGTPGNYGFVGV